MFIHILWAWPNPRTHCNAQLDCAHATVSKPTLGLSSPLVLADLRRRPAAASKQSTLALYHSGRVAPSPGHHRRAPTAATFADPFFKRSAHSFNPEGHYYPAHAPYPPSGVARTLGVRPIAGTSSAAFCAIERAMRFVVTKVCSGGGKARAGALHIGGGVTGIETPALLLSTRKGLPSFLSCDLLASLPLPDSLLLHVCPTHFIEGPPAKTISAIGGLHGMLGLPDHILVAAASDSIESLPSSDAANKFGASFETPSGRRLVKPSDYMELISCMKPNIWASLADEVPAWVNEKRNKVSVDRTLRWLDACIALDVASGANSFGVIVGGSSLEQRKLCATEVSKRNVSGFWIAGFGLGESIEERCSLLNAVTDCLPPEKPRLVSRLGLPEEVLEGVAAGIDLFDSTYIYQLTMGGFALIFPVDMVEREMQNGILNTSGGDSTKINLHATTYRKDMSRLVDSCNCFTCQNHTRAYLNHLLNVHEMLAQILLEIHNTHHYLRFFHSIREAIKVGEFDLFRQEFVKKRHAHFTAVAI